MAGKPATNRPFTHAGVTRAKADIGETLIEIVLTIVIVGLTVTALLSSLATVGNASNAQRKSVQIDVVMRNYAEATKFATQTCVAGANYTVVYPGLLPTGFSVSGAGNACPTDVLVPQRLTLSVQGPSGPPTTMQIKVNTP